MKKISLLSLEKQVKDYAQSYYEGKPQVTDAEFDNLVNVLRLENPNSPLLKTIGWGYNVNKVKGTKHQHDFGIVGSLDKVHHVSELPLQFNHDFITVTEKLDGASCVAYYEKGKLFVALSRGNGEVGIDVTDKYKKICQKYDLEQLEKSEFSGAIRGEIVMSYDSFVEYKKLHEDAKSPRNVATGMLMRDEVIDDLKYIDFVAYKIHGKRNEKGEWTYTKVLDYLSQCGFLVPYHFSFGISDEITDEKLKELFEYKESKFPCDGFVLQNDKGIKVHENGWFEYDDIAYKFEAHKEETKVVDIEWKLSKNNLMIPVVIVEPVELSGAIVTRTSGFNYKYIVENKVGKGAVIKLMRSGEVVPDIQEVLKPAETLDIPTNCPVCGETLKVDGVHLVCENPNCENIEYSRLYKWIEVIGVRDMLGVGPALIDEIISLLKQIFDIKNIRQLYSVINSNVVNMDISYNFATETAKKVKAVMDNLQQPAEISDILVALNISGLGEVNSKKVGEIIYTNIDNNAGLTEKMRAVNGVGDSLCKVIMEHINLLQFAFNNTIPVLQPKHTEYKYQITVTGSLSIPRESFKQLCEQNNILLSDNIKTSKYLVTNNKDTTSSKMKKAKELGIEVLTEKEFVILENLLF